MPIHQIIHFFSVLIWLLPPFRQYGQKYFIYFLLLAVIDPIATNCYSYMEPLKQFAIFSFILLLSLLDLKTMIKKIIYTAAFICTVLVITNLNAFSSIIFILIFHTLILTIFITDFIKYIGDEQRINYFIIALVLYETTIILKMYFTLIRMKNYTLYFFITTGFETLLAIFFIMFRVDDKRLHQKVSLYE